MTDSTLSPDATPKQRLTHLNREARRIGFATGDRDTVEKAQAALFSLEHDLMVVSADLTHRAYLKALARVRAFDPKEQPDAQ